MLGWAVIFFIIAIIAGLLGFTGIAGTAVGIAKILFFVFLIMFVIFCLPVAGDRPSSAHYSPENREPDNYGIEKIL